MNVPMRAYDALQVSIINGMSIKHRRHCRRTKQQQQQQQLFIQVES